jgi:hypothetical protein
LQTSLRQEERLLQKQNLVYTMDNLDTVRVIKGDVSNIAGTTEQILSSKILHRHPTKTNVYKLTRNLQL